MHLGGQVIETTAEHPFYVDGKGWTPVKELHLGDLIVGNDDSKTPIDLINFTGETKPVYNLRVSEDHTYFVGGANWGFSVWVHNAYAIVKQGDKYVVKNSNGQVSMQEIYDLNGNVEKVPRLFDTAEDAQKFIDEVAPNQTVNWINHNNKHVSPPNKSWKEIVKGTRNGGDARYLPGTDIEALERLVYQQGTVATNGRTWKVMEFDKVIGASDGKPSRWMRVEISAGTIHGHPITLQEYRKLTR